MKNDENKFCGTPPPKKKIIWGAYTFFLSKMKKLKIVQNCLKGRENWSKTSFGLFSPPPRKIWGAYKKLLSKMKKIKVVQNCLKWSENWSKIIFGFLTPLYSKRKFEKVLDDKK